MIKVAIVLMKGFDGCGVSRFAIEHQKQLRENGDICDVYSYSLSRYIREASHKDKDIIKYENFTDLDFSSYDILILNSYEQEFKEEDLQYYKSLKCIKVAMMHEILRQNVSRIPHIWDWLEASDIVSSFSYEMDFVKDLYDKLPNVKYFPFKMAMNDNDMDNLYYNSLNQEKINSLVYYGRWTTMKNPSRLFEYKKLDPSLNLSMIGVEKSIGAAFDIFNNELCEIPKKMSAKGDRLVDLTFLDSADTYFNYKRDNSKVTVFPPADRDTSLSILSKSLYGCSFYRLKEAKANNLGNRMEYTQIEMSCVCLPVFDIDWGKRTFDVETGKSFYELGDNAIYSDIDNLQDSINEMNYLASNPEEYNRRRENIFNLVKRNYGSRKNIEYFYNTIINMMNRSNNMKNYHFCVPSLGRAGSSTTLNFLREQNLLSNTYIFCYNFEEEFYRKEYPNANIVTVGDIKNLALKRASILNYGKQNNWNHLLMIDDDFRNFTIKSNDNRYKKSNNLSILYDIFENAAQQINDDFTVIGAKYNFLSTCDLSKSKVLELSVNMCQALFFNLNTLDNLTYNSPSLIEDLDFMIKLNLAGKKTYRLNNLLISCGFRNVPGGFQNYLKDASNRFRTGYEQILNRYKEQNVDVTKFLNIKDTDYFYVGISTSKLRKYIKENFPNNYIDSSVVPSINNYFDLADIEEYVPRSKQNK